jgi:hypothetical protein
MVNEADFTDNASQWEMWEKDKNEYKGWMTQLIQKQKAESRSHGFHHVGQYKEEITQMEEV